MTTHSGLIFSAWLLLLEDLEIFVTPSIMTTPFKLMYFFVNLALCSGTWFSGRNVFIVFGGAGSASSIVMFLATGGSVTKDAWISVVFGTILSGAGFFVQKKNIPSQFPFWAYLFGSTIFFGGWSTLYSYPVYTSQLFKFIFFLGDVGLCFVTLYTQSRIYALYGLLGIWWYIGNTVYNYYWNSWWLPIILTGLGLGFIAVAVWLSKQFILRQKAKKQQLLTNTQLRNEYEMGPPFLYTTVAPM